MCHTGHELAVEVISVGAGVENVEPGQKCSVEPYMDCGDCIACRQGEYLDTATVNIQSVDHAANSITVAAGHNIVVGQTLRLRTKASSSDACAMQPLAPTDLTVQSVAANVIRFRNDITDLGSQGSARCMLSATSCTVSFRHLGGVP